MRKACAWCGNTIAVYCDHCNATLIETRDTLTEPYVCINGLSPLLYTQRAIDQMEETHGMCRDCAVLPRAEREALLKQKRGPTGVPAAPTHTPAEDPNNREGS
jgi:hypothetical protein